MHLLSSSLFVDQIAACGKGDLCYVRNDDSNKVKVTVVYEAWVLEDTIPQKSYEYVNELEPGSIDWFDLPFNFTSNSKVILIRLEIYHNSITSSPRVSESVYLTDMPKDIMGLQNPVHIEIVDISINTNGDAAIVLKSDKLALYVVLTTRAEGLFSPNCITLRPFEKRMVKFHPLEDGGAVDLHTLRRTLRVEHLGLYMASSGKASDVF
mmetsp:Transcript_4303/g.9395  ORF Transcript_4303/g.9395 Transcript_4303/m.9395 type:complete len:209 (-) Transcript_4303:599-1225(-)